MKHGLHRVQLGVWRPGREIRIVDEFLPLWRARLPHLGPSLGHEGRDGLGLRACLCEEGSGGGGSGGAVGGEARLGIGEHNCEGGPRLAYGRRKMGVWGRDPRLGKI